MLDKMVYLVYGIFRFRSQQELTMDLVFVSKLIYLIKKEIGKEDLPTSWLEFFLLVAISGDEGVTTMEVCDGIGMAQAPASRMVKIMSTYLDPKTRSSAGLGIYTTFPDHEYRHRQRVILTQKGKDIIKAAERLLK